MISACKYTLATSVVAVLVACGGSTGNNSNQVSEVAIPVASWTLAGTVASGAAWQGASVTIVDSTGKEVCGVVTDIGGNYSCNVTAASAYPLAIIATRDSVSNYSISMSKEQDVANVSQLTTLLVSKMVENGDVDNFRQNLISKPELFSAVKVSEAKSIVEKAISPISSNLDNIEDFFIGRFKADGTSLDKVLDLIDIDIKPTDLGYSNIEVTYKVMPQSEGQSLTNYKLSSISSIDQVSPPVIPVNNIPTGNILNLLNDFIVRNNNCYQEALNVRVNAGKIISKNCLDIFPNSNYSNYLHQSTKVGEGAFADLLNGPAGKVVFTMASLEDYLYRADGSIDWNVVISGKMVDGTPFSLNGMVLKLINNKLYWFGDQNPHVMNIYPSARKTTRLQNIDGDGNFYGSPINNGSIGATDWYGSGWIISIKNQKDSNGNNIIKKVTVRTPAVPQLSYQYVPTVGRSILVDPNKICCNGRWIHYAYMDNSTSATLPSVENGLLMAPTSFSEAQIEGIEKKRTWLLEVEYANGSPNAVFAIKTINRPLSVREIKGRNMFTNFTKKYLSELKAAYISGGNPTYLNPNLVWNAQNTFAISAVDGTDAWINNPKQTPPNNVLIYGNGNLTTNGTWDDAANVKGVTTSPYVTRVNCSSTGVGDTHCNGESYASGSLVNDVSIENISIIDGYESILFTNHITTYKLK